VALNLSLSVDKENWGRPDGSLPHATVYSASTGVPCISIRTAIPTKHTVYLFTVPATNCDLHNRIVVAMTISCSIASIQNIFYPHPALHIEVGVDSLDFLQP